MGKAQPAARPGARPGDAPFQRSGRRPMGAAQSAALTATARRAVAGRNSARHAHLRFLLPPLPPPQFELHRLRPQGNRTPAAPLPMPASSCLHSRPIGALANGTRRPPLQGWRRGRHPKTEGGLQRRWVEIFLPGRMARISSGGDVRQEAMYMVNLLSRNPAAARFVYGSATVCT